MSTILKTLKKLEEEKSVLDQKLDLKGMVLKEETAYLKILENERRRFFLVITIVASVLTLGGVIFYYFAPTHKAPISSKSITAEILAQKKPRPKMEPKVHAFEGVSMAGIPNKEKAEQVSPFFKPLAKGTISVEPTTLKQNIPSKQLTQLLPKETLPTLVPSNLKKIGDLAQSTTFEKNVSGLPTKTQSGNIPDIKVKGIIFFEEKSLSNHVIITTPSNSNLKLRMGDLIENAVLKSIHPNRVVFLYQGKLFEMSIGQ